MDDIIERVGSKFEETAAMKQKAPQGQGCDAAMEQLIKRSKKGAKIQVFFLKVDLKMQQRVIFVTSMVYFISGWKSEVGIKSSGVWQQMF